MNDVNGWLLGVAFVLGLVLTWLAVVARETRDVPVHGFAGARADRGGAVFDVEREPESAVVGTETPVYAAASAAARVSRDEPVTAPEEQGDEDEPSSAGVEPPAADVRLPGAPGDGPRAARHTSQEEPTEELPEALRSHASPYGAGSARSDAMGYGPRGFRVKGDEETMTFHEEGSPYYAMTPATVWFRDGATAQAAGFARWDATRRR